MSQPHKYPLIEQLRDAYGKVTIGNQEPTVLYCSTKLRDVLLRYFGLEGDKELRYNLAVIKVDPLLADDEAFFENTCYPEGKQSQKYNFRFRVSYSD